MDYQRIKKQARYQANKILWNVKPEMALKIWFRRAMHQDLNLEDPQSFNEKIQWMKLNDSTPLKGQLSDKLLVRDYVEERVGDQVLLPVLGIWDNPEDIDFDALPEKFALKASHGSGFNIIVTDKSRINRKEIIEKLKFWLSLDFSYDAFEMHYQYNHPRVFAEPYLDGFESGDLIDYKVFHFNNGPDIIEVMRDRSSGRLKVAYYDENWEPVDLHRNDQPRTFDCPRPHFLQEMLDYSAKLAEEFSFVRVDWYETNNKLYFGEMTFTPAAGIFKFEDEKYDRWLGSRIILPVEY